MGTSFFYHPSGVTNRYDPNAIIIGSGGSGFAFVFWANRELGNETAQQWWTFLKSKTIHDDYGEIVSLESLKVLAESAKEGFYLAEEGRFVRHDPEGYLFFVADAPTDRQRHRRPENILLATAEEFVIGIKDEDNGFLTIDVDADIFDCTRITAADLARLGLNALRVAAGRMTGDDLEREVRKWLEANGSAASPHGDVLRHLGEIARNKSGS